jgi:hypothetical protein
MKTKPPQKKYSGFFSKIIRLRAARRDWMLALNMSLFNFTDGWSRILSKHEYARFYA